MRFLARAIFSFRMYHCECEHIRRYWATQSINPRPFMDTRQKMLETFLCGRLSKRFGHFSFITESGYEPWNCITVIRVRMVFDLGPGTRLKLPTVTLSNYRIAYESREHRTSHIHAWISKWLMYRRCDNITCGSFNLSSGGPSKIFTCIRNS